MASTIDVTERKRAELQLQQEKDRAQRYLDIAGVMLIANDAEGRVSLINRKGCEVLGYEQEEIIGKNLFDISIPERMRHEVKAAFNKLMTGELEPFAYYENPVLTKNGEERVIAWHNVLLKDGSGNIVGTLSSGEDVTERKKTEDRVSIQRDLGMALGATYSLDEALKLCLEAALKISGLDCGGIYLADSKSGDLDLACHKGLAVEFVKSASHYEADSVNTRLVMAGEPIYSRHTEFGAPLDTVEQREGLRAIAIMPVFYENHVIGCLNVASHTMDDVPVSSRHALEIVTAQIGSLVGRIKSRQELQTSETRYRLLAENVRDVILAMDMDLRFTYVSPSVKYLGDRTAEDVMSMSFEQLLTPSSQELAKKVFAEELAMADVTEQDPTWSRMLEVEVIHRDGSTFWVELKMSFMRDTAGRPVAILGIMRDISERKKAEEERRALEQKAQLASRLASVGELAAGVAHEINNPLTGVIGYAELLMQEDVPENIKNDLEIIHDGARRVADIVKGLLRFARQTKPERTVVDIDEVIEVCLRLRAYELETSNIKVVSNLAPALPLTIADAGQLQQVFLNLLINAEMEMKLAHGKGKLIIKAEQVNNNIRIYFKDDGPGIAKENLEKIFDPFFTTREVGKGTGLGLSICHGIITEHGGRIWAESQLGKGATFIVELPVVAEKRRATKRQKATRRPKVATKAKILVVDDEPVVRQLVTEVLTVDGHEVETTDDGKDALNRIKSNGYSLILLDMKLPGMSGGELYERIKGMAESLAKRVVFITGDVMAADTEALLARTKVPCITKPFDVHKLKADISRLLISSRPKQTAKSKKSKTKS
jgi:PAS domain S-box-containing protein